MIEKETPQWFAIYTKSRNEKKVNERLLAQGFEAYLPIQKKLRQWSDRKKWVQEPLLTSYVFVKVSPLEIYKVLRLPGVVQFVSFEGKPAPIPQEQIDVLKMFLGQQLDVEVLSEELEPGDWVEITIGSLIGFRGELVSHQNQNKILIKLDHISHQLLVTLPANYVAKAVKRKPSDFR